MKNSMCWWLLTCLLIGQICGDWFCIASPRNTDYQSDDYDYGDDDSGTVDVVIPIDSDTAVSAPPYFEQADIVVKAKPDDHVVLNCDVRNFKINNVVMWYRNNSVLTNGQVAIDRRVESTKNNSLLIRNATPEDSDDYYCVVLPQNVRQKTTLRVSARLSIFCDGRDVTDRSQTFKQGDHHKLECRTYLPTKSTIKWSFNGHRIEGSVSDVENGVIQLDNVDEENVGMYQCLGDDGSRDPPHGMVTIYVQYSPKVSTHRHHVNAQAGSSAELYCDYRANPIANSFWMKNGKGINLSEKHAIKNFMHKSHNRSVLTVKEVEDSDIGEYLCYVENTIGSNEVKVQLSYHPETPQFEDIFIDGNKVTLHWLVRSMQPLSEAVLDYKLSGSYTWSTVSVIQTQRHGEKSGIWKITHQMELKPGEWHARVKTKNTNGWSNFSPNHDFVIVGFEDMDDSAIQPPDELVRAGFGSGGSSGNNTAPSTLTLMPGLWVAVGFMLLRA